MKQDTYISDSKSKLSKFNELFSSLKAHFFLAIFLTGLACCLTMHVLIFNDYEERAVAVRISEMQTQLRLLSNRLIKYNYLQDTDDPVINAEIDYLSNFNNGRVIIINDDLNVIKDTYEISNGKFIVSEETVNCLKTGTRGAFSKFDKKYGAIELVVPIVETKNAEGEDVTYEDDTEVVRGAILLCISMDPIRRSLTKLSRRIAVYEGVIIFTIICIAYMLAQKLMKPFDKITTDINEVKAGYTEDSIEVPTLTEARHIAIAFNSLLRRMKVLDDSRQEFVSNVSHELRTPITSMKVLAESLVQNEAATAEEYKEFMTDIVEEIDRETKIINDLLTLVRTDSNKNELNLEKTDINEMMETIIKTVTPLANNRGIDMSYECYREVEADVDSVKLSLAISNLIENAVKYNVENGWIKCSLNTDHKFFYIKVADSGVGIPDDAKDKVFDRFYRVDKARSRDTGGTGLGLSITRSIINAHKGTIKLYSESGKGTTFTVKIPLEKSI